MKIAILLSISDVTATAAGQSGQFVPRDDEEDDGASKTGQKIVYCYNLVSNN